MAALRKAPRVDQQASRTALSTAVARGRHRFQDDPPWVLDDPFALPLVGPSWRIVERRQDTTLPADLGLAYRAGILARSRYAEDRLVGGSFDQYVLLGAGLDSFVWRRPDLVRSLRVFEVDHPASQQQKRDRAAAVGLPEPDRVTYLPVDLELDTLASRLADAGFDRSTPAFFSWLGVAMYLQEPAVEATLRTVAGSAPGSEIVLTYAPAPGHLDDVGRRLADHLRVLAAAVGEPQRHAPTRQQLEALCQRCGLVVVDHPEPGELARRYFSGRTDGLAPHSAEAVVAARVGG